MSVYDIVKDTMAKHKKKIELFQWATISGVSSLVFSEYISCIRQKQIPVRQILVPSMRTLSELFDMDGQFIQKLSNELIEKMISHEMFKKYSDAPELVLFSEENIEVLKTVFDLYILNNVSKRIPETIEKKFGLRDPKQQVIREDRDTVLFRNKPIDDLQIDFIVEEVILQLLLLLPTMKKEIELPEGNRGIQMTDSEILSIANDQAICPIHFTPNIFRNESVNKLLMFVTSTQMDEVDTSKSTIALKGDEYITWIIDTNPFNQVSLTKLIGIETENTK